MTDTAQRKPKVYARGLQVTEKVFTNGGSKQRMGVNVERFVAFLNEHKNERGYVNLEIVRKRVTDEYGTHYVALDDWTPNQQSKPQPSEQQMPEPQTGGDAEIPDDLPF